ncbi:MAG: glycosyltransferase family A protein [Candidatus Dormibacteria bacterium]
MIVCTCDRPAGLARTMRSILADPSVVERELLVVDNGSEANTEAVAAAVHTSNEGAPFAVRLLRQPIPGKSHALNLAMREAAGDALLFTDDDVEVEAGWADALVAPFVDSAVGLVGGRTLPAWPAPPPAWVSPRIARALGVRDLGESAGPLQAEDVIGANMAVRAAALPGRGDAFDTRLGPRGAVKMDYEEVALAELVGRRHQLRYAAAAVVRHHIDPARVDLEWLRRMSFQRGFGWVQHEMALELDGRVSLLTGLYRAAFYYPRTLLLRVRHDDSRFGPREADRELEGFRAAGRYVGRLLYRWPRVASWAAGHLA